MADEQGCWREEAEAAGLTRDEYVAVDSLLGGRIRTVRGRGVVEFLKSGSEEEKAALRLLSRLLEEDRLPASFCQNLAWLFNPDLKPEEVSRKAVFIRRSRSRSLYGETLEVGPAVEVLNAMVEGHKWESAVSTVAQEHGVSERTISRMWGKYIKLPLIAKFVRRLERLSPKEKLALREELRKPIK
jgi:hypothetical protein